MRVVVGADTQRQALVQRAAGEPVEFGGAGLEHGHPAVRGQLDGLADPLVVLHADADVQGRRGHAGPQRLHHRVAPGHELGRVPGPALRSRGGAGRPEGGGTVVLTPATRPARARTGGPSRRSRSTPLRGRRAPLRRVARPHGRGRGRPLALELAPSLAAGARPRLARLRLAGPGTAGPGTSPGPVGRRTASTGATSRRTASTRTTSTGTASTGTASTGTTGPSTTRSGTTTSGTATPGTARLRVPGSAQRFSSHRGPSGVSSTMMPIPSRPSLIASAVA